MTNESSNNRVLLRGHLGKDPEVKIISTGSQVANFQLAIVEQWQKDGQQKQKTEWVRVVAWDKLAETAGALHKGSAVAIEGRLQTRTWDDKQTSETIYDGGGCCLYHTGF